MRKNELAITNQLYANMLNMAPSPLQTSAAPVLGMMVVGLGPSLSKFYFP